MQASTALAAILADAKDGIVAIDIETAPHESERQRLAALAHKEAVARGTLRALIKLRGDAAAMGKAKADLKALIAQKAYAERAGLDPDRASIRLLQVYGGGRTVLVADMTARRACKVFEPLWDIPVVAHNAAFELSFLHRAGIEPAEIHCTMQAVRLLYGPNVASLEHAVATVLGIDMDKTCQTSDWSQPAPDARADRIRRRRRCCLMAPRKQGAAAPGRKGTGLRNSDDRHPRRCPNGGARFQDGRGGAHQAGVRPD